MAIPTPEQKTAPQEEDQMGVGKDQMATPTPEQKTAEPQAEDQMGVGKDQMATPSPEQKTREPNEEDQPAREEPGKTAERSAVEPHGSSSSAKPPITLSTEILRLSSWTTKQLPLITHISFCMRRGGIGWLFLCSSWPRSSSHGNPNLIVL